MVVGRWKSAINVGKVKVVKVGGNRGSVAASGVIPGGPLCVNMRELFENLRVRHRAVGMSQELQELRKRRLK